MVGANPRIINCEQHLSTRRLLDAVISIVNLQSNQGVDFSVRNPNRSQRHYLLVYMSSSSSHKDKKQKVDDDKMSTDNESNKNLAAHEIAAVFPAQGSHANGLSFEDYKKAHAESIADVGSFWGKEASERLEWYSPFTQTLSGDFHAGDVTWFAGGKLNVSYNAVDRHVHTKPNQVAIVFEGDEPDDVRKITYIELQRKVSQIANTMLMQGVQKGDVVTVSASLRVDLFHYNMSKHFLTHFLHCRFTCP